MDLPPCGTKRTSWSILQIQAMKREGGGGGGVRNGSGTGTHHAQSDCVCAASWLAFHE